MDERRDRLAEAVAEYLGCSTSMLTDAFAFEEYGADIGDVREVILRGNRALRTTLDEGEAGSIATFGDLWARMKEAPVATGT